MDAGTAETVEAAVAVTGGGFAAGAQGQEGTAAEVTVAVAGLVARETGEGVKRLFRRLLVALAVAVQGDGVGLQADAQAVLRGRDAVRLDGSEGKVALAEASGCFQCLSCLKDVRIIRQLIFFDGDGLLFHAVFLVRFVPELFVFEDGETGFEEGL